MTYTCENNLILFTVLTWVSSGVTLFSLEISHVHRRNTRHFSYLCFSVYLSFYYREVLAMTLKGEIIFLPDAGLSLLVGITTGTAVWGVDRLHKPHQGTSWLQHPLRLLTVTHRPSNCKAIILSSPPHPACTICKTTEDLSSEVIEEADLPPLTPDDSQVVDFQVQPPVLLNFHSFP